MDGIRVAKCLSRINCQTRGLSSRVREQLEKVAEFHESIAQAIADTLNTLKGCEWGGYADILRCLDEDEKG